MTDGPRPAAAPDGDEARPDPVTTSPGTAPEGHVSVGRIGRGHGLDGTVHVTRPRAGALEHGGTVVVAGVAREIVRRAGTEAAPLIRLEGITDRSAAVALRGQDVYVPRKTLPPLEEDEFWPDDLVGLRALALDGSPVGMVVEVLPLPSCDALRVQRPAAAELLVPLVRDAVPTLDVRNGTLMVDLAFLGEDDAAGDDSGGGGDGAAGDRSGGDAPTAEG
ncbi:MAG: ribosome maturation factor RimM [Solirubrobacteraceae bacterium]